MKNPSINETFNSVCLPYIINRIYTVVHMYNDTGKFDSSFIEIINQYISLLKYIICLFVAITAPGVIDAIINVDRQETCKNGLSSAIFTF